MSRPGDLTKNAKKTNSEKRQENNENLSEQKSKYKAKRRGFGERVTKCNPYLTLFL